jgi:hypothetical protein
MAAQLPHPKSDEQRCRSPSDATARHDDPETQRDRDRHCDREPMTERERTECPPHSPSLPVLRAQRNREQPSHSRIEAVDGT